MFSRFEHEFWCNSGSIFIFVTASFFGGGGCISVFFCFACMHTYIVIQLPCTVRKMGLILRSIERMLKMQFSMARKFTLQPLRRYDVKPPEKQHKRNITFDEPCLQKNLSTHAELEPEVSRSPISYSTNEPHLHLGVILNYKSMYILFVKFRH